MFFMPWARSAYVPTKNPRHPAKRDRGYCRSSSATTSSNTSLIT